MRPYHQTEKLLEKCYKYGLLADYYKYINPQKHIHYYKKHFNCVQKLVHQRRAESVAAAAANPTGGEQTPAMLRVLHASPNAPAVDIYANGNKILQNVVYKQKTDYLTVPPGRYQIDIFPAGQTAQPVLTETVNLELGTYYTAAAAGDVNQLQLLLEIDALKTKPNRAKVRFWHLSPTAPAVDIAVKGGDVLFPNVSFPEATGYLDLPATKADLEVRAAGTNNVVLTIPNVSIRPTEVYTALALGYPGGNPPLEATFIQP